MASYNTSVTESIKYLPVNLSASEGLTVNIDNPGPGSSYVVFETRQNENGGYTEQTPKYASGSYTLTNVTKTSDDYKAGFVVAPGGGSIDFTPAIYVSGSDFRVRGTSYRPFYDALLDRWPNAAAAYSLRRLNSYYDGPAIRVRRSSDDEERNIFFSGGQLDTTSLINWTKEEVITYQSNFGVDTSGVANDQTIITANQDNISDGTVSKDDCLKVTVNTALNETHQLVVGGNGGRPVGNRFRMSFEYYIPSDNLEVNGIYVALYTGDEYLEITGSWQSFSSEFDSTNTSARLYHLIGNRDSRFDGNGTDHYYIRNIQYTQLTSDGYVETWYDQSGNGNHATQTTAASQPTIVTGSVVVSEGGVPALDFDGSDDYLQTSTISFVFPQNVAIVSTTVNINSNYLFDTFIQGQNINSNRMALRYRVDNSGTFALIDQSGTQRLSTNSYTANNQFLNFVQFDNPNSQMYTNNIINTNTLATTYVDSNRIMNIGTYSGANNVFHQGSIQEIIRYASNQSSNRPNLERAINSNYKIYWDGAFQRLLDQYSGAAAAYSLRALNSQYTGPLVKVRRASDDVELDIYADYYGNLNIGALESFCSGTNGFVTTWYDQSGGGNHATQATDANQPQIVSAGNVILENGKPTVEFAIDLLIAPFNYNVTSQSTFAVFSYQNTSEPFGRVLSTGDANEDFQTGESYIPILRNNQTSNIGSQISFAGEPASFQSGITVPYTSQSLFSSIHTGTQLINYYNTSTSASTSDTLNATYTRLGIGNDPQGSTYGGITGKIHEILVFTVSQADNRTNIESNINSHYNIY